MLEILKPLRQPAFAMLWSATVVSHLGFWVQDITMSWLITDLTTSPALVALLPVAALVPIFLLSLPAGALADRTDLRHFLLTTQALLIANISIFAALIALDAISITVLLWFACISGILMAVSAPARQSVLPSMVEHHEIRGAVMLSAMGFNVSRAVGPMIGGILLSLFGPLIAILSYIGSCFLVALALFTWRSPPFEAKPKTPFMADITSGFRHVVHRRDIRNALLGTFMYFILSSPVWAFIPLIAKSYSHGDSTVFSLFLMAIGIGSIVGGLNKRLGKSTVFVNTFKVGNLITAGGMLIVSLTGNLYLSLFGFFILGIGWIALGGGINSFVLTQADPSYRSRAISFVMIIFAGGLSLGSLMWGQIARFLTVDGSILLGALLLLASTVMIHFKKNPPSVA